MQSNIEGEIEASEYNSLKSLSSKESIGLCWISLTLRKQNKTSLSCLEDWTVRHLLSSKTLKCEWGKKESPKYSKNPQTRPSV